MSTDNNKSPRKYIVVDHDTGIKYEVTEHTDELGYIHKQSEPEVEKKPVSLKEIERLYKKEFPESQPQSQPVNEIKKFKQLIDNAQG